MTSVIYAQRLGQVGFSACLCRVASHRVLAARIPHDIRVRVACRLEYQSNIDTVTMSRVAGVQFDSFVIILRIKYN